MHGKKTEKILLHTQTVSFIVAPRIAPVKEYPGRWRLSMR